MKAIQIQKYGGPEVLAVADVPQPNPKPDQVVVKLSAVGVNYIDVYFREGRYPSTLPLICGQEGAGTVAAIGSETTAWKIGDRVAYTGIQGAYAEYAAVPANRLVHIPPGVSEQQAASAMLQGMTAHYLVHDSYALRPGDSALIHAAAGGVGLLLVQMAKMLGARVIATVGTDDKAELAREAGADEVIVYTRQDFEVETKRLTGGKGVHAVYDGVGKTTFDKDLNILRPRGTLVLFGGASGAVPPFDPIVLSQKGSLFLTRPTLVHHILKRGDLEHRSHEVLAMIGQGKLNLRIGHVYPLGEAAQAHRDLEGRKTTGKLLLIP